MTRRLGGQQYWTVERIVAAIREEAVHLGHSPNAMDLRAANRAGRDVPYARTVYNRGLTLPEVYRLAGLPKPINRCLGPRAYCKRGHEMTGDNVYTWHNGSRRCRACHRAASRAHRLAERQRRRPAMVFDPTKAARITERVAAHWGLAVPRRSEATTPPSPSAVRISA